MIDWTKPIETRDGQPARVLCTDLKSAGYPVIVAYEIQPGGESIESTDLEGFKLTGQAKPFIRNVPEKGVRYVNIYRQCDFSANHRSRLEADSVASPDRIACVRVEYTEGQMDP